MSAKHNNTRNKPLKFIPALLAACLLFALPAQTARADYAPGPAAIPGMLFYEAKSQACMAKITTDKETPLMRAAKAGNAEKVKALIAAGADPNVRTEKDGTTALRVAVVHNAAAAARTLVHGGADVNAQDSSGSTVRSLAESAEMKAALEGK